MPRPIVLFLLGFVTSQYSYSQSDPIKEKPNAVINGKIKDTLEKKSLADGAVLLLRQSDSILVQFTRTDPAGNFKLKDILPGRYVLLITYPAYADYVDQLEIKDAGPIDLPLIGMALKSKLLEEVVVNGSKGGIRIKGDTTEFRADSFHTQAGATVEDLLKKLPGIQVDRNGKITAQGKAVKKVLVDGEEFFGDDPTLVTQNFRADMVDKVQVFDKKSDQAAFTGIDDGKEAKTINLMLKENKKNGIFGKVTAETGTEGYYTAQAMINYFKKKKKFSAYGAIANIQTSGMNWQDGDSYSAGITDGGDFDASAGSITMAVPGNDLDTWGGSYSGQGFPKVKTGGVHYNDKWADDRQAINGNYKVMQLEVNGTNNTTSKYILPDTLYYNNERQINHDRILRHSLDGTYELKIDSSSSIKLTANGGTSHKTMENEVSSEARAIDSNLVNQNNRSTTTTGDNRTVNGNLFWRKKLAKKGRTLSFNFKENYTTTKTEGYLNSTTNFYDKGLFSRDSVIDQFKSYHSENILLESKLTYTEPLSNGSFLYANYGISVNNSQSDRSSFSKNGAGKYTDLDSLYSNNYQFNIFTQQGGLSYILNKKKLRFNAGTNVGFTNFHQRDLMADTTKQRTFVNWFPQASLSYSIASMANLSFEYHGNTTQPSLDQLQPIRTNEDPLNITIGNPGLKPQFSNQFSLNYLNFKILSERNIMLTLNYSFTQNSISSKSTVDSSGRRTTQAVNVNGNYGYGAGAAYYFKWKAPDLHIGLAANVNNGQNVSLVNDLLNTTKNNSYIFSFNINKTRDKAYDIGLRTSASYTTSKSSINTGVSTNYWTYTISPALDIYLPAKLQVHSDGDFNLRPKSAAFPTNNNVILMNAWVGRKFLKTDDLLVKISGNDLFNQNKGFSRTANSNFISQNTYSTIQRYFMLSVVWNFTKSGLSSASTPGKIEP